MLHITNVCPVPAEAIVRFTLVGDPPGVDYVDRAGALYWGPGAEPDGAGRIASYQVLDAAVGDDGAGGDDDGNGRARRARGAARRGALGAAAMLHRAPSVWPPSA